MRKTRENQIKFLDGIALGAFLASIFFLFVFWWVDLIPPDSDQWVGFFGNIIVAGFSLGAAFLALRGNRLQIVQANDIEDERRENALIAARSVLPSILSQMSAVARNNLLLRFERVYGPLGAEDDHPTEFKQLPQSFIPDMKQCIEHADRVSQDRLANILRHFQVQQAREKEAGIGIIKSNGDAITYDDLLAFSDAIGWAVVHGLVSDAFGYARGSEKSIPLALTAKYVEGAFIEAGIVLENHPELMKILQSRIDEGRLERQWSAPINKNFF